MAFSDAKTADETFQWISTAAGRLSPSSSEPIQQPVEVEGAGSAAAAESAVWSYFHQDVSVAKVDFFPLNLG